MKSIFLFLFTFAVAALFTKTPAPLYARIANKDGSLVKGTAFNTYNKGIFDNLLIVKNLSGGTDHSATIELEVPTSGYTATFRSLAQATAAQPQSAPAKPIATKNIAITINPTVVNATKTITSGVALFAYPI